MLFSKEPQTPGHQKNYYFKMASSNWHYSNQQSQHILIWGLAFKSRTQNKNLMQIELQSFHIQFPRSILIWFSWVIFGIQTIFIHLYWQMVGENIILLEKATKYLPQTEVLKNMDVVSWKFTFKVNLRFYQVERRKRFH